MMNVDGHLRGLLRFAGRERRAAFWLWVGLSFGSAMVIGVIGMALTISRMVTHMQRFVAEHPDQATVMQGAASYSVDLGVLVVLIVFCCLPTQEHTNRYGPPPGPRVG